MVKDPKQEYVEKKSNFEKNFKEFHENVFSSKVLDGNKTAAVKNTETHVIDKMVNSALALDTVNYGEGTMALIMVTLRELLALRDRINDVEYKLLSSIRDIKKLNNELGINEKRK